MGLELSPLEGLSSQCYRCHSIFWKSSIDIAVPLLYQRMWCALTPTCWDLPYIQVSTAAPSF